MMSNQYPSLKVKFKQANADYNIQFNGLSLNIAPMTWTEFLKVGQYIKSFN